MKKNILITGASSGLGAALATEYAGFGHNLFLFGRNKERLENISIKCKALGARVETFITDVTDQKMMEKIILDINTKFSFDLVFANAGISGGTSGEMESGEQIRKIFSVNIDGVLNTILPTIELMRQNSKGHVVIISSLASYIALPSCPAYSASKACIRFFGEALKGSLKNSGVDITVVTPGYIKTAMTEVNNFYMPFLMSSEKAAMIIRKKLEKKPSRIAFPYLFYMFILLISYISTNYTWRLLAKLPKKPPLKNN